MSNTPERVISIDLTELEATDAIQLFDAAVKSCGLRVAGAAMHLTGKLQKAFSQSTIPGPAPTI